MRSRNQYADYNVRLSALNRRRRPRRRRRMLRRPRLRNRLTVFILVSLAVSAAIVFAGITGSLDQSTTVSIQTSTPSPAPFTTNEAQAVDASQVTTTPDGLSSNTAQSINGTNGSQPTGTLGNSTAWVNSTVDAAVIPPDPVAHYRLDDGSGSSVASDSAGSATGTLVNLDTATAWVAGTPDINFTNPGALDFSAPNGYVDIPDGYDAGTGDLTVSLWYYANVSGETQVLLVKGLTGDANGYELLLDSNGEIRWDVRGTGNSAVVSTTASEPTEGEWHHVAGVLDRSTDTATLYVDGVAVGSESAAVGDIDTPLYLGLGALTRQPDAGSPAQFLNGKMDDVRIYNFALSASQVSSLVAGTAGNVGNFSSIAVVDENTIYVSYQDVGNSDVKFAKSTDGGTTWTNTTVVDSFPFDLEAAISAASPGDTINIPAGTYTVTSELVINKSLTLIGAGAATTIIQADANPGVANHRVFTVTGGPVVISNVTIRNGVALDGGGIKNLGTLTVNNSTITGNQSNGTGGGGINNQDGTLTINSSTVSGNTVGSGGVGGGILNCCNMGTLTINNSTISGNSSVLNGGGIFNQATLTINNSTITNNTTDDTQGGGIAAPGGTTNFKNTIIGGNTVAESGSPDCSGTLTSFDYNLVQDPAGCTIGGDTSNNITGQDPLLGALADNGGPTETHALQLRTPAVFMDDILLFPATPPSPAIDAGNPAELGGDNACLATDQRGVTRPQGIACDIGAYEEGQVLVVPDPGDSGGFSSANMTGIAAPDADNIFMTYYDSTNNNLRFAKSIDGGDTWAVSIVDDTSSVGKYASIAAPSATNVFISYYDYDNTNLKVACSTNGGDDWTLTTVDSDGSVGKGTSNVALDNMNVFVSYQDFTNNELKLAESPNCGGIWSTSTADVGSSYDIGDHTSLAVPNADTLFIAYDALPASGGDGGSFEPDPFSRVATANSLRVARSINGGGWDTTEVEGTSTDLPRGMIAAVDATHAFISFRDTGEDLRFARTLDGVTWSKYTIDGGGFDGDRSAISIVDANTIYVSYYDDMKLKFAETATGGVGSTWFSGSFDLDTDGDGSTDSVFFTVVDLNSDDSFDLLEISSDDSTFGEGMLTNSSTDSDDDERINAGAGSSTSQNVTLGEYTFLVSFDHQVDEGGLSVSVQSVTWFTGQFTIDADADGVADNSVYLALSDSDSNGLYDTLDLSSDDVIFGEELFEPRIPSLTNGETGFDDDERIIGSSSVLLGANYTFIVDFENNPATADGDAPITSQTWFTGTFTADADDDGSDDILDFVVLDFDSDGLYDTLELDADGSGSYDPFEFVEGPFDTLEIGGAIVSVEFENNPAADDLVSLIDETDLFDLSDEIDSFLGDFDEFGDEFLEFLEFELEDTGEFGDDLTAFELEALFEDLLDLEIDLELAPGEELTDEAFADLLDALFEQSEEFREQIESIDVPPETISPVPSRIGLDISGQPFVWDEVVIVLDFDIDNPDLRIAQIAALTGGEVVGSSQGGRIYQVRYTLENREGLGDLRELADRFPGVTSASRHYLIDPEGPFSKVPDDSVFSEWNADSPSPDSNNWNLEFIRAPSAWDITTGSDAVIVGVIDGALDSGHTDLSGNVVSTFGPFSAIANGHGTHVSGIICAEGNNGRGISGVAWNCSLRMFDFGARSPVLATDAMIRAVDQGASVINISLQWVDNGQCGTLGTPPTLKKVKETNAIFGRAIEYARNENKDVLWVIAAGNECRETRYASPASLVEKFPQDVIVVGSIDRDGGLSSFSNYGELVDVAAPGGGILSTLPRTCTTNESGELECKDEYGVKSGSSMAAPHVAGLAVLIRSAHPEFNARRVKACIVNFATLPVQSHDFNVIDAEKSVQCGVPSEITAPNIPAPAPLSNGEGRQRQPFGGR